MKGPAADRGFSLVELAIVAAILAIGAAVAAPRYSGAVARYRAQSAARRIAADIQMAQALARSTSSGRRVIFGFKPNAYALTDSTTPASSATYQVDLADAPCHARIISVTLGNGDLTQTVAFDGYGRPRTSATVVVASGGAQATVEMAAESGAVQAK
jgi:prepilin-type N-terminal cleavage/methylation domain-containing protein